MRYQRILMVGMTRGFDAEEVAGGRIGAVGRDQQLALQVAAVAQTHAHMSVVDDLKDACIDEYDAGGGRRAVALPLQGATLDDVPKVGLSQFRAVEAQRPRSLRLATPRLTARLAAPQRAAPRCAAQCVPHAHALVGVVFLRGQELPRPADGEQAL